MALVGTHRCDVKFKPSVAPADEDDARCQVGDVLRQMGRVSDPTQPISIPKSTVNTHRTNRAQCYRVLAEDLEGTVAHVLIPAALEQDVAQYARLDVRALVDKQLAQSQVELSELDYN